jgi:uncharacterized protein (TIGR02271 family)
MFGGGESFVPLAQGTVSGSEIRVPFGKDKVKGAPRVDDSDGHLTPDQEDELYRYYGMDTGYSAAAAGRAGHETSGPNTDDAMTRSEERLHVGTQQREAGRARLRKYVVTENVTTTVPVSREEVRVEREPITDTNRDAALRGADITEDEHEVVLREERPVVEKEAVPVERVRLGTETVTEEQQVSEQVRKEKIDMDVDEQDRRR